MMVRDFHRVIGLEAREQVLERTGRLPDAVVACVGGGSNAIGIFHAFLDDPAVRLVGFEAGGDGVETGRHAATLTGGSPGALHGAMSYLLQDEDGQTARVALDLGGARLPGRRAGARVPGRLRPGELRAGHRRRGDGRVPPAVPHRGDHPGDRVGARDRRRAAAGRSWRELGPDATILVNLSGRGDKDVDTAARWFQVVDEAALPTEAPPPRRRRADRGAGAVTPHQCRRSRASTARRGLRDRAGRGPGRARRLPARRLPDRRRLGGAADRGRSTRAPTSSRSACPTPTR